jgi:hypothetical protein
VAAIEGKLLHAKRNAAQVDTSSREGGHYHIISITVLETQPLVMCSRSGDMAGWVSRYLLPGSQVNNNNYIHSFGL